MVQHLQQCVDVAGDGGQHDAPPRLIDADRPEPRVAGVGDLLQVQAGVGGGVELVEDLGDAVVDGLLQLAQVLRNPLSMASGIVLPLLGYSE